MVAHQRVSDGRVARRVMKLTRFERSFMNSSRHAGHTRRTAQALFERMELPENPVCLEIGCGQGALARLLVEHFDARVIATDYDPQQVAVARERLSDLDGKVELHVVDARAMPFDGAQFDAVFSFGILHHILRGWRQAVAETARVLRPAGWFVVTEVVAVNAVEQLSKRLLPGLDLLGATALRTCLAENGLRLEHWASGGGGAILAIGPMAYCAAVARLSPSPHGEAQAK
jgi:cyclopropane fatty-acyl-phospholipid synthase-like methyltransferase